MEISEFCIFPDEDREKDLTRYKILYMESNSGLNIAKMKRVAAVYNMIPNLAWSLLCLIPLYIFCEKHVTLRLIYWFAGLSLATIFIPEFVFDRMQISKSASFYRSIGIETINRYAQQGEWINRILRKKFPEYKVISFDRRAIKKLIGQSYMFEKFHFMMFVFFCLVTFYALLHSLGAWAFVLIVANLLYNVFPNLLQQYVRIRMRRLLQKLDAST